MSAEADDKSQPNHERRLWQGPLKHMGVGGGLVAAMLTLTPMKNFFYTREEGVTNSADIVELKGLLTAGFATQKAEMATGFATQRADLFAHATEETHKHERIVDTLRAEIKSEKDDRIRDISLVENLFKIKKTKND